jgi:3-oxoacyl-[acyl-carrier protein] reductase
MRNILVTGASRGLGLGIAQRLAANGDHVIAVARRKSDELNHAVAVCAASKGQISFVAFDLAQTQDIPDFTATLRRDFGSIYALVNNAGIGTPGVLATMPDAEIARLIQLNTLSPILLSKYIARFMLADGGGGRIINMASIVADNGFNGLSVYSATKASLVGFTRSLARELGRAGITVNAVAPGFVATEMTHGLNAEDLDKIVRRSALRRIAEIDDVASTVEFLLGDGGRNITGAVMTVDAGATA